MRPGFKSRKRHFFFFFFFDFFNLFIFCGFFLSLLLQCKFANSTLLSLLSFSYFITPYDAQASSAFSALIIITNNKYRVIRKYVKDFNNSDTIYSYINATPFKPQIWR